LDDRLERLLEVERLGNRLRDPSKRFELAYAALGVRIQLGVLDRLRDLCGDRNEELDLGVREFPGPARADIQCTRQLLARENRYCQDRLVLVLGEVGE